MSKYEPLHTYLIRAKSDYIPMSFSDIENVLGFALPASSRRHRAWWSNNTSNNVMTEAWMKAGFETENVDMESRKLLFRRVNRAMNPSSMFNVFKKETAKTQNEDQSSTRRPLFGALKDQMVVLPNVDYTESLWDLSDYDYDLFA